MRNSNTLKVLIFTRDISNNPEKLTIYARITVNGKRAEISLKRYVSVNEWDENKGRLHGLTHKASKVEQNGKTVKRGFDRDSFYQAAVGGS